MARFSFAAPVLPGKDGMEIPRRLKARMPEYEESARHMRLTMDRAFSMPTPMGEFVVLYYEGALEFPALMEAQATSGLAIDRDLFEWIKEIHGVDVSQGPPMPPPETVGSWIDSAVTTRKAGLGFCAPLAPGKTDAARAFAHEAYVTRAADMTASRRAIGGTQEHVFVNSTPAGDLVCVYVEGDDPRESNRRFAASQSAFDQWFKNECLQIFAPGVDFNQPLPEITTIWDWVGQPITA